MTASNGADPDDKAFARTLRRNSRLVYDLMAFIRRYVVMSRSQLLVTALWVIHTHAIKATQQTPYLAVTSPEKQCGKSRLLEVLDLLVARPWVTMLPTEAVVYRTIHQKMPTLLLDETDAIFHVKSSDRYEGLRAILNSGHRRGAKVPRCLGASNKVVEFNTFCAKVLAGIGTLPDTVADRSIPIRLERRKREEHVSRFISYRVKPEAQELHDRCTAWGEEYADVIHDVHPDMPEQLNDRMQEGCEILVVIAEQLNCGQEARAALVELLSGERLDDKESLRLHLLRDIKAVFDQRTVKPTTRISTNDLILALHADQEAPWANYFGRGLDARDLGDFLRHYGIRSTNVRLAPGPQGNPKGFKREQFYDAWVRYLNGGNPGN